MGNQDIWGHSEHAWARLGTLGSHGDRSAASSVDTRMRRSVTDTLYHPSVRTLRSIGSLGCNVQHATCNNMQQTTRNVKCNAKCSATAMLDHHIGAGGRVKGGRGRGDGGGWGGGGEGGRRLESSPEAGQGPCSLNGVLTGRVGCYPALEGTSAKRRVLKSTAGVAPRPPPSPPSPASRPSPSPPRRASATASRARCAWRRRRATRCAEEAASRRIGSQPPCALRPPLASRPAAQSLRQAGAAACLGCSNNSPFCGLFMMIMIMMMMMMIMMINLLW